MKNLDKELVTRNELVFVKENNVKTLTLTDDGMIDCYTNSKLTESKPFAKLNVERMYKTLTQEGYTLQLESPAPVKNYIIALSKEDIKDIANDLDNELDYYEYFIKDIFRDNEVVNPDKIGYSTTLNINEAKLFTKFEATSTAKEIKDSLEDTDDIKSVIAVMKPEDDKLEEVEQDQKQEVDLDKTEQDIKDNIEKVDQVQQLKDELDSKVDKLLNENEIEDAKKDSIEKGLYTEDNDDKQYYIVVYNDNKPVYTINKDGKLEDIDNVMESETFDKDEAQEIFDKCVDVVVKNDAELKMVDYDSLMNELIDEMTSFPSGTLTDKQLTINEIDDMDQLPLSSMQVKYLRTEDLTADDIINGLKSLVSELKYKPKDEPFISIKEYIDEIIK